MEYLSPYHLLTIVALILLWRMSNQRPQLFYGGIVALPVLLVIPTLSESYFELFNPGTIAAFFVSQALIVFSMGVIGAAIYEKLLRTKLTKVERQSRPHFLIFLVGLVLSVILFDLFNQPLLPSLIYGLGLNILIAVRFQASELTDLLFSSALLGIFYVFIYSAVLFDLPGQAGRFWFLEVLSGYAIFGVAIEKLITVFVLGLFWGPLYVGLKDVFGSKS